MGLLVDVSGSQQNLIEVERQAASQFFSSVLKQKDVAFLISFGADSELLQDITGTPRLLQQGLSRMKPNFAYSGPTSGPVPTMSKQRGTVLYDAVYLAAHDMLASETGRKAIILITDGEDEGSKLSIKDAIEAAQKADAIVYVLLCADRGGYFSVGMSYSGEGEMHKLTEATGGRVINVGNKFDKLKEAFDQIAAELRSQYNLGYTSTNPKLDGTYRKLEVKSKQNYKIQTRAGYYATAREPLPQ